MRPVPTVELRGEHEIRAAIEALNRFRDYMVTMCAFGGGPQTLPEPLARIEAMTARLRAAVNEGGQR